LEIELNIFLLIIYNFLDTDKKANKVNLMATK